MWTRSRPYVVSDNRNKKLSKSQDDRSDEGNCPGLSWVTDDQCLRDALAHFGEGAVHCD